jgi:hypothetical protein
MWIVTGARAENSPALSLLPYVFLIKSGNLDSRSPRPADLLLICQEGVAIEALSFIAGIMSESTQDMLLNDLFSFAPSTSPYLHLHSPRIHPHRSFSRSQRLDR